jgi:competence protein ComGF
MTPMQRSLARQSTRAFSSHRRGFNLAELLFVIAAISGLSVVVMTVVGLLITAEQHAAEDLWVDVTISSLACDLRQDAHQAHDLEAVVDEQGHSSNVTLLLPGETRVTYECTAEGVTRREAREGGPIAIEIYRLALGTSTFHPPGDDGLLRWSHVRAIPNIGGFSESTATNGAVLREFNVFSAVGLHADMAKETD